MIRRNHIALNCALQTTSSGFPFSFWCALCISTLVRTFVFYFDAHSYFLLWSALPFSLCISSKLRNGTAAPFVVPFWANFSDRKRNFIYNESTIFAMHTTKSQLYSQWMRNVIHNESAIFRKTKSIWPPYRNLIPAVANDLQTGPSGKYLDIA